MTARLLPEAASSSPRPRARSKGESRAPARPAESPREDAPRARGRIKLSDAAKARLLDTGDLSRFELARESRGGRKNHHADYVRKGDGKRRRDDGNRRRDDDRRRDDGNRRRDDDRRGKRNNPRRRDRR